MRWGLGLSAAVIVALLAGCGASTQTASKSTSTSGTQSSNVSATTSSSKPSNSTLILTDKDWPTLNSNASKGDTVDLKGQVFASPITQGNATQYEVFLDPQNSNENVVVQMTNGPTLQQNDYVEIKGTSRGTVTGQNALGGAVNAVAVVATSITKISRDDAIAPTIKTVSGVSPETQNGFTLQVDKVQFAKQETRIFLTATNKSGANISVNDFESTLVQGTHQLKQKQLFNANLPTFPTQIANGVVAHEELVFDAANLSGPSLKFVTSVSSDNFNQTFNNFSFTIPSK